MDCLLNFTIEHTFKKMVYSEQWPKYEIQRIGKTKTSHIKMGRESRLHRSCFLTAIHITQPKSKYLKYLFKRKQLNKNRQKGGPCAGLLCLTLLPATSSLPAVCPASSLRVWNATTRTLKPQLAFLPPSSGPATLSVFWSHPGTLEPLCSSVRHWEWVLTVCKPLYANESSS